jgi:tight adherence protein B
MDFQRTVTVLADALADPTADLICEVLLVAHQTGAADLDSRLVALAADRATDLRNRREAVARQAGVRFARRFVLIVPLGMAACGLSIGTGRAAYARPAGQLLVCAGILVILVCWVWAGTLLRLPEEPRVLRRRTP